MPLKNAIWDKSLMNCPKEVKIVRQTAGINSLLLILCMYLMIAYLFRSQ